MRTEEEEHGFSHLFCFFRVGEKNAQEKFSKCRIFSFTPALLFKERKSKRQSLNEWGLGMLSSLFPTKKLVMCVNVRKPPKIRNMIVHFSFPNLSMSKIVIYTILLIFTHFLAVFHLKRLVTLLGLSYLVRPLA